MCLPFLKGAGVFNFGSGAMTNSISEINLLSGYQPVANEETRKKFEQAWGCILPLRPGITQVEMFYAADVDEILGEGGTGDDFYAFPFS